ncbi:hypothetical protein RD792_010598 [Penstemon davidsonii]|uniref:NAC domain-containing protein n=1 Tax=Penstemon davidsonii TaxID=160366 RepID=A0ABR0D2A5_9LAMI|nr:hypothetical protein RD792_010598 [Penstemon davidsonii]
MHYNQFQNHYGDANSRVEIIYVEEFPSGYRFLPTDSELIVYYLKKKVKNEPIPYSKIHEVDLYKHNPQELSEIFSHPGEKQLYFFTPRERKYLNGSRPNRAAGSGYWKATGADKAIHHNGEEVGSKKSLVFYEGRPPKGKKTNWLMQEYMVREPDRKKNRDHDMRLDEWVLCRIYKRDGQKNKDSNQTYEICQEAASRSTIGISNEGNLGTTTCDYIGMGVMNRLGIDLTQSFPQAMDPPFANFNQNSANDYDHVLPNSQSGWENEIMQRVYPVESGSEKINLLENWDFRQQAQFEHPTNADDCSAAQFEPLTNLDPFIDFTDPIFNDIVLDTDQLQ